MCFCLLWFMQIQEQFGEVWKFEAFFSDQFGCQLLKMEVTQHFYTFKCQQKVTQVKERCKKLK